MCVPVIVGFETLQVGGVFGQLTVTVACVVGSVHGSVVGNWIESALCADAGAARRSWPRRSRPSR
jgi:outer membrane lipoprotein SlyB